VKSLVDLAREKPDQLRYASAGPASLAHLAGALFAASADIKIKHIPYRTSAQSVLDLVASRVDIQFGALPPVLPHIQAGSLKAVAVTGAQRLPQMPNVPTLKESGFPAYEVSLWQALVAPARTPAPVITKLNEALMLLSGMPDIAAALERSPKQRMLDLPTSLPNASLLKRSNGTSWPSRRGSFRNRLQLLLTAGRRHPARSLAQIDLLSH
jgi:tripartite-type tricarboxylate transporter receptor subunit TctC